MKFRIKVKSRINKAVVMIVPQNQMRRHTPIPKFHPY